MVPPHTIPSTYFLGMAVWLVAGVFAFRALLQLRRRWKHSRRVRIANAGLAAGMLLFGLTLLEIGFALFCDRSDSFSQSNISQRWMTIHVVPNADGFRDDHPLHRDRKPGQRRIFFVGDSFTFGHGVEVQQRFSDRIAEHFPNAIVSNVALPGVDIRMLTDELAPLALAESSPGDVMVYAFVPNDIEYLTDDTGAYYQQLASVKPRFFLFQDTYFFNWAYYRIRNLSSQKSLGYYAYLSSAYSGAPWTRMEEKLEELVQKCKDRDVELRIVAFPFLQNLGPTDPFQKADEKISAFCEKNGIPFLNLRPRLANAAIQTPRLTVNADDAHPNSRCHAIAADSIQRNLLGDFKE